ncbi:hypothetical protein Q5P01_002886 [Channa striata]|uniref:Uncharacterized protein n=1 Tax=Channa striata TaxID=64152 RepID=A0AA88NTY0_CHASR|nr:hypothetical protein Q5P01_002886 [Channa striata]
MIAGFIFWKCKKTKRNEAQLQRTQEELDALGSVLTFLRELKSGLENQSEELIQQLKEMEREKEEDQDEAPVSEEENRRE